MYTFSLNTPQEVKAMTTFKTHPVRFLSVSDKGTLCYTYDGELYTQKSGARPEKVKVELVRDDEQQLATLKFSQEQLPLLYLRTVNKLLLLYVVMCL